MSANGCPEHGRFAKGCDECRRLDRAYDRKRRTAIANGTWLRSVPADKVRAHLAMLAAAGMSQRDIAAAARLPVSTVQGVKCRIYVQGATAAAILAVRPVRSGLPAGMVSIIGARRRVQALAVMGWSLTEQARRVGMCLQQVWQIAKTQKGVITVVTDRKFRALFEELSATPGPSTRAKTAAAKNGWLPPLAWDRIDDPNETPNLTGEGVGEVVDPVAVVRALEGDKVQLSEAERAAALRLGVERGLSLSRAASGLGMNYFKACTLTREAGQEAVAC